MKTNEPRMPTDEQVTTRFTSAFVHTTGRDYFAGFTVLVADEGGGPFIILRDDENGGEVRIDLPELEAVVVVARLMIAKAEKAWAADAD